MQNARVPVTRVRTLSRGAALAETANDVAVLDRVLTVLEGVPGDPAPAPGDRRLGEFLGDAQQRVGRALHHLGRDLEDPLAPGPRHRPEQLEGLPGPES